MNIKAKSFLVLILCSACVQFPVLTQAEYISPIEFNADVEILLTNLIPPSARDELYEAANSPAGKKYPEGAAAMLSAALDNDAKTPGG